jgi:hypothetical protein
MEPDPEPLLVRIERSPHRWRTAALATWLLVFAAAACDASGNFEQLGELVVTNKATVGPEKGGTNTTLTAARIVLRDSSGRQLVVTPDGVSALDAHGKRVGALAPATRK